MDVPRLLSWNVVKCVDDFHFLTLLLFSVLCLTVEVPVLPSVVRVETEQEREFAQQLKQANDAVARLQDELSDIRLRSAPLWEKEMKNRDSKIFVLLLLEFA